MRENTEIRLTEGEMRAIKELAVEVFGEGTRVLLFGSRTDPSKKEEALICISLQQMWTRKTRG